MVSAFPAGLDTSVTLPTTIGVLTPQSAPSHSGQHDLENDAIVAVETKLGVNSSAVATTIDYLLKNSSSTDPGHKHSTAGVTFTPMLLSTTQTVTGAKTFNAGTFKDKGNERFDVTAYGATGDGVTNDTTAVNLAIAAAIAAAGGVVYFPKGTYVCTALSSLTQAITMLGDGPAVSQIYFAPTSGYLFTVSANFCQIVGLTCYHTTAAMVSGGCVNITNTAAYLNVEGCYFAAEAAHGWYNVINCSTGDDYTIQRNLFAAGTINAEVLQDNTASEAGDSSIIGNTFSTTAAPYAIYFKMGGGLRIISNKFLGQTTACIYVGVTQIPHAGGTTGMYITSNSFELTCTALSVNSADAVAVLTYIHFHNNEVFSSGQDCIVLADLAAKYIEITGNSLHQSGAARGINVGPAVIGLIDNNFITTATPGILVNASADVTVGPGNHFQNCTGDVTDASGKVRPMRSYNATQLAKYLNVGALSAPTNVTAGDTSTTRLFAPNIYGSLTNGASGTLTLTSTLSGTLGFTYIGTSTTFAVDETNKRVGIQQASPTSALHMSGTYSDTIFAAINGTLNGSATDQAAMRIATQLAPSASIANSHGLRFNVGFNPTAGITITQANGILAQYTTGSGGGAITLAQGIYIGPVFGTVLPGTSIGLAVDNVGGSASITTATGIQITSPTSATNKYGLVITGTAFNGIGTATPSYPLDVTGSVRINGSIGFFNTTPQTQQASGANLTNSVTSGGSNDTIADFTSLTVYATDAAAIRNDIYQLARKLKQVNDALRVYGLLT